MLISPEEIKIDPIKTIDYPTAAKGQNSLLNTEKMVAF